MELRFGSVLFQYLSVESSVYRHYVVSISDYGGGMCVGIGEDWGRGGRGGGFLQHVYKWGLKSLPL